MIHVEQLTKTYGLTHALQGITFQVQRGEVIGFLGPNGAGKSTTMKILAGYLMPTSGRALVDGRDVVTDSLEVRRRIGYLPETTPLYTEMRVDEYLRFVAEIRGVPGSELRAAIGRVVELCGLQRVTGKNILELSKGYRQRVGLAQAMVHNPDVLILDEPTSGLDPNQIIEVRGLIKRLSENHTLLLSTHYLQEVEASCSRVIIVHRGRIVADDTRERLVEKMPAGTVLVRIKGPAEAVRRQLGEVLPGRPVSEIGRDGEYGIYRIEAGTGSSSQVEEAVAHVVVKNGWGLAELQRQRASLEDVFRSLTLETSTEAGHA
jgi:ABC-2 type transport system ATP-binding protein